MANIRASGSTPWLLPEGKCCFQCLQCTAEACRPARSLAFRHDSPPPALSVVRAHVEERPLLTSVHLQLPPQVATVVVDPPQEGEVRIKIIATALCHTGGPGRAR